MKAVKTIDVLREARERIAAPQSWTRGVCARDAQNNPCLEESVKARCWCLVGSVNRSVFDRFGVGATPRGYRRLRSSLDRIAQRRGYRAASHGNDVGGRMVAVAILDDAIAELEAKECA